MSNLQETLNTNKQSHLSTFVHNERLKSQLESLDWLELNDAISQCVVVKGDAAVPQNYEPAPYYPLIAEDEPQLKLYKQAAAQGEKILAAGKVAAFTVAGGQGTRLGFDGPKGTLSVSPIKNKSLFQLFAEQIVGRSEKYKVEIPWYIMCSPLNHAATKDFFVENTFFGLKADNVKFFIQGVMPATDFDGQLLRASEDSLAFSPNGHGGSLKALIDSASIADMKERGIEHLSYFQVDNPLINIFDPLFIGLHELNKSDMSSRSLTKTGPFEKMGNFAVSEGKQMIIEYSDLPEERAIETDEAGKLKFLAGSPAIHLMRRDFIEKFADTDLHLPFHRAEKKVTCIDADGVQITPETPNAVKFETFVFDALPMAQNPLILELPRGDFSPVKNKTGVDSLESSQADMDKRVHGWFADAGITIPASAQIELSPKAFMGPADVAAKKEVFGVLENNKQYYFE